MREMRVFVLTVGLGWSFLLLAGAPAHAQADFVRGDVNVDGILSISDAMAIRRIVFLEGGPRGCLDAADTDDDGEISIHDVVFMVNITAAGLKEEPAAPFPAAGQDPTDDELSCESYDVTPPQESDDFVRLGEVSGAPGDDVVLPVFVTNDALVEAMLLVIQYDPQLFELRSPLLSFTGTPLQDRVVPGSTLDFIFDDVLVIFHITTAFLDQNIGLPPGEDVFALGIRGRIPETAPPGATAQFEFTTLPETQSHPAYRTELSIFGEAGLARSFPKVQGAVFKIVADVTFFRRGDSNGDGVVDISDGSRTLDYLFLGTATPSCLDAADADDSGEVLLNDAVFTFEFLFFGRQALPGPYPDLGPDPTEDELGCAVSQQL